MNLSETSLAYVAVAVRVVSLVLSIMLISIFSDLAWMLAQALGAGNAPVGFVIDLAATLAAVRAVFGWAFSP